MSSKTILKCVAIAFCLMLVVSEFANAAPSYEFDSIRDLYELLLRSESLPERYSHQLVRKGGRDPAVRLRFGRRADPYWQSYANSADNTAENTTN